MATTTVTFLRDYATALTAKLTSVGGTGTPNASGYNCTNTNGLQSLTITEALVGEFYLYAYDSLGDIAYQGYVVLADDTGTYRVEDTVAAIKADAALGTADGGLVANAAASKAKTDLIGTGTVMLSAPVSGDGELLELILDTDYLAANGRALEWTFDQITGITTSATGKFGLKNSENGTEVYVNSSGAVTDLGGGTFKVSFDITNTALAGLSPEEYDWSVEVLEGSYKITIARNRQRKTRVNIVEKQT